MRLTIIGQAAFGEAVLDRLRADGHEVVAVSAPASPGAARPDPLLARAEALGIPVVPTGTLKDTAAFEEWRAFQPELCVMAFVTDILPDEVFALPARGTIQYHPSLLPLYRGSSAMNWPIIFGAHETGLTIFWPDKGIDTGPVLLQKRVLIEPDETMGSLYFNKLFPMGVDAMSEAVALVAAGNAPAHPQDHTRSTYEPPCRDPHAEIHWHEPADRVYALIRGCNPQPGAWFMHGGTRVRVFDCARTGQAAAGMPGRILGIEDGAVTVRLNGGVLRLARVQPEGQKKQPAQEWAEAVGLKVGARLR
jgi:methionyl-tRNA formyltransferase